ncbi:hypothetical protein LCGC14_1251960 [marine sediment metagenome]|uniref:Uncharacterized protein n=1 Tax=marine sediment metagenome TaxID=412755 RepID=A0A0F9L667_9ZZZZ
MGYKVYKRTQPLRGGRGYHQAEGFKEAIRERDGHSARTVGAGWGIAVLCSMPQSNSLTWLTSSRGLKAPLPLRTCGPCATPATRGRGSRIGTATSPWMSGGRSLSGR